jgi:hypothetical protein
VIEDGRCWRSGVVDGRLGWRVEEELLGAGCDGGRVRGAGSVAA